MNWRVLAVRVLGAAAVTTAGLANAGEQFLAIPGLWKTEYKIEPQAGSEKTALGPLWHCVDEQADPWVAFAQLMDTPEDHCTRTYFSRNSTFLQWRLDCTGRGIKSSQGSIRFDSPKHYTGTVEVSGYMMDIPVREKLAIEGHRLAACTSPAD